MNLTLYLRMALAIVLVSLLLAVNPQAADAQRGPSTGASGQQGNPQAGPPAGVIPDQYIVVLRDDVREVPAVANEMAQQHAFSVEHVYEHALRGYAARIPSARLDAVRADPRVLFVSPDIEVQAYATSPLATGESAPTGVLRTEAATTTSGSATAHAASTVNVAVLDTGIDLQHPDLNVANGKSCIRFAPAAQDDNGHGTHVAGTLAAKNSGTGAVGVAPNTKLYAVKVLDRYGSGSASTILCGIDWVTANTAALNIKVANMSLGGGGANDNNCGYSNRDAWHKAICRSVTAGVTYVVAAGNSAANLAGFVPAAYPEVLTVTAISDSNGAAGGGGPAFTCRGGETDDSYATYSNYAVDSTAISHTIAAPGTCIASTWLNGGYNNTLSGTSMAAPHVAGMVALCIGNGGVDGPCRSLTPAQIIQKLRSDAQTHATSTSTARGNGFAGDPNYQAIAGKYFGHLAWAGGY